MQGGMDTLHVGGYQELLPLYKSSLEHISKCLEEKELTIDILTKFPDLPQQQSQAHSTHEMYADFKKTREDLGTHWAAHAKQTMADAAKAKDCSLILKIIWRLRKIVKLDDVELRSDMQKSTYSKHFQVLLAVEHLLKSQTELNQSKSTSDSAQMTKDTMKTTDNKDSEPTTRTTDDEASKPCTTTDESAETEKEDEQITGKTGNTSDDEDIETPEIKSHHKDGHVSPEEPSHEAMNTSEDKVLVVSSNISLLDNNAVNDKLEELKKTNKDLMEENTKVNHELESQKTIVSTLNDDMEQLIQGKQAMQEEFDRTIVVLHEFCQFIRGVINSLPYSEALVMWKAVCIIKLPDGKVKDELAVLRKAKKKTEAEKEKLLKLFEKEIKKLKSEKEILQRMSQQRPQTSPANTANYRQMKHQIDSLQTEKESLMQRLSLVAGRKMKDNNPAIADLGDPHRPERLAERFREIYDNEWTEVLDYITENTETPEEDAVKDIANTLQAIFSDCKSKVNKSKKRIIKIIGYPEDALNKQYTGGSEGHDPTVKIVKDLVKGSTERIIDGVIQKIKESPEVQLLLKAGDKHSETFVTKCSSVCLFMCAQDPPMVLDFNCSPGDPFDKDRFTPYTSTGDVINYLVWPVLYLSDNGSIMSKGIAQGKKK